jgi:predicted Rossmann fold flavoprotein
MPQEIYDIIVIGSGAAGMFACIHSPSSLKKLLLEKNNALGKKVLLSGGERCNVSNISIDPEEDYFGKNKKALFSLFKKFSNYDMISWLEERWVQTHIEDRGRIILHSGKSQELLILLQKELQNSNTEIRLNTPIIDVDKEGDIFKVFSEGEVFYSKKIIISTGGKSFAQVGTDGWWFRMAEKFWIKLVEPYKWLCALVTRQDLSLLSGTTVFLEVQIYDDEREIYREYGSFLFTHFGISGPLIFNGVLKIGEVLRDKWINTDTELTYMRDHIRVKLIFNEEHMTKKIRDFFGFDWTQRPVSEETGLTTWLDVNDMRTWAEAKVTGGWVELDELTNTFESKKIPGLYFIGEVLDLTGKTGWFNLQVTWSEGYVVGKSLG